MMTFYLLSAVIGGVLVLFSAFGGGDHDSDADADLQLEAEFDADADFDVDADADFDADADADLDGDADHDIDHGDFWLAFASIRFWTYAFSSFGVTGLLLTALTGMGATLVAIAAAGTGLVAGMSIATAMRLLKSTQSSSSAAIADMLGAEGRVLLTVRPNEPGKIRVSVKGDVIDLIAVSEKAEVIEPDTLVLVVAYDDSRARVVRRAELLPELSSESDSQASDAN